jgi:hypothetical protein
MYRLSAGNSGEFAFEHGEVAAVFVLPRGGSGLFAYAIERPEMELAVRWRHGNCLDFRVCQHDLRAQSDTVYREYRT